MLDATTTRRITAYIVGSSVALAALALLFGGVEVGLAAVVGGVFAIVNWMAIRWLGRRLLASTEKRQGVWMGLLMAKTLVSLLAVFAILSTGVIDPIGFVVGLSSLVFGLLAGTFHRALAGTPAPNAEET